MSDDLLAEAAAALAAERQAREQCGLCSVNPADVCLGCHQLAVEALEQAEQERDRLREALMDVLASAAPHPREHPVMFEAWTKAKLLFAALAPQDGPR